MNYNTLFKKFFNIFIPISRIKKVKFVDISYKEEILGLQNKKLKQRE